SVFKENLKSVFVINRKIVNTTIGREVVEALSDYPVPVLKSQICQRVALADSAGTGQTVLETDAKSEASREITALGDELVELCNEQEGDDKAEAGTERSGGEPGCMGESGQRAVGAD